MSFSPPAVSSRIARLVLRALSPSDVRDRVIEKCGVDRADLSDPDGTVSLAQMGAIWHSAHHRHPDATGLAVLNYAKRGDFGVLEHLLETHESVGGALESFVSFQSLLQANAGRWSCESTGAGHKEVRLEFLHKRERLHDWVAELGLAALLRILQEGVVGTFRPRQVRLTSPPPPMDKTVYQRAFGAQPEFSAPSNAMVLDERDLSLSLRSCNPPLKEMLQSLAHKGAPTAPETIAQVVTQMLQRNLENSTAPKVADRLGMSERTLRRKLQENNTTYSAILERVRRQKVIHYLEQPHLSLTEIAYLVGFTDVTSFSKAFQRWFGTSARQFRANQLSNR